MASARWSVAKNSVRARAPDASTSTRFTPSRSTRPKEPNASSASSLNDEDQRHRARLSPSVNSVASEVAALIAEDAFAYLDAPVMRLAAPDVPAMPFSPPLEHAFMIDAEKIGAALRRLVSY